LANRIRRSIARSITAFFTPNGKKSWTIMQMGSLNAMSIFVAMMMDLQIKWNALAKASSMHGSYGSNLDHPNHGDDYSSVVIADDVTLHAKQASTLLKYFKLFYKSYYINM
jgi:hypothetical protein